MKILEIVLPLIGVLIGWGCTELSRLFTNSYQKKQTLNNTLSILLDLYFQIKRMQEVSVQIRIFVNWYMAFMKEHHVSDQTIIVIRDALNGMITTMISNLASQDVEKINAEYENALKQLSRFYPVSAFRLRGQNEIKYILVDIDAYYKEIEKMLNIDISDYKAMCVPPSLQTELQLTAMQTRLSLIKEQILEQSESTNCSQRKAIKQALDDMDAPNASYTLWIEKVKEQIVSVVENNNLI